jgi:hypothetical protein
LAFIFFFRLVGGSGKVHHASSFAKDCIQATSPDKACRIQFGIAQLPTIDTDTVTGGAYVGGQRQPHAPCSHRPTACATTGAAGLPR